MFVFRRLFFYLLFFVFISGCNQTTELYQELPEKDANDMMYILQKAGIKAEKTSDKTGYRINVPKKDLYKSMTLLRTQGYPKEKFSGLDSFFPADSLMQSEMSDTLRYFQVIENKLQESISQIDGVILVRVHILPAENQNDSSRVKTQNKAGGAAVMIKYNPDYQIETYQASIKSMVANSISGLTYNDVQLSLFPETLTIYTTGNIENENDKDVILDEEQRYYIIAGAVFIVVLLIFIGYILISRKKNIT